MYFWEIHENANPFTRASAKPCGSLGLSTFFLAKHCERDAESYCSRTIVLGTRTSNCIEGRRIARRLSDGNFRSSGVRSAHFSVIDESHLGAALNRRSRGKLLVWNVMVRKSHAVSHVNSTRTVRNIVAGRRQRRRTEPNEFTNSSSLDLNAVENHLGEVLNGRTRYGSVSNTRIFIDYTFSTTSL